MERTLYHSNYLASILRSASLKQDDAIFAYLISGEEVTYRALFANAEKTAKTLIKAGVEPGDRVAVQVGKSITTVELYLGCILSGGVFLPLNTDYTVTEVEYFLTDASPKVFVCDQDAKQAMDPIASHAKVKTLLTLDVSGLAGSLFERRELENAGFDAVPREANDLAAILYTSGTTGRSKGAMLSHGALAANALTLVEHWQFSPQDRLIHALPIFHIHGLFVALNITLCAGSSLYFLRRFDLDDIVACLPKASVLMGVPTFYVRLLKHAELTKGRVANMRLFVSGSAPLLAETHQAWQQKTGHAILERYGMTETNMNTSNPYDGERRPGMVGLALSGVEVKITDPETSLSLANGEVGQIEVRGPNLFTGYWQMPEKTAEELRPDGWFITGDLGCLDEDAYLTIVGRSKDLIISGGYNVYPKEVELVIDEHESVLESAVIGVPHTDFGEAVVAIVVAKGKDNDEAGIRALCNTSLAAYKRPKSILFLDELPRNTMGKVQKAKLRTEYSETFSSSLKTSF